MKVVTILPVKQTTTRTGSASLAKLAPKAVNVSPLYSEAPEPSLETHSQAYLQTHANLSRATLQQIFAFNRRGRNIGVPFAELHNFINFQAAPLKKEMTEFIESFLNAGHRECNRGTLMNRLEWEINTKASRFYLQKLAEQNFGETQQSSGEMLLPELEQEWPFLFCENVKIPTEAIDILKHSIRSSFWQKLLKTNFKELLNNVS